MSSLAPYDAVLLLSFGGPEGPEEVMPFLRHVTGGRGIPEERLAAVAQHYLARGGVSPINAENRRLVAALEVELESRGENVPVLWGNRHAPPFTADVLRAAHEDGLRRVVTLVTSAYPSYSGCRQYREDLATARDELDAEGASLEIDKVRVYSDHPGFLEATTARTVSTVREFLAAEAPQRPQLVFVTHSIPETMARASGPNGDEYLTRHRELADAVAGRVRSDLDRDLGASLVFCSRSGPPSQPWLEPDIGDHLAALAADGIDGVVVVPIGFVADHMEVVHDLDTEAAGVAADLGLAFARVPTVRDDPRFVAALVDLLEERAAQARDEPVEPISTSTLGPLPPTCVAGCCPNPRRPRPALCGDDSNPEEEQR